MNVDLDALRKQYIHIDYNPLGNWNTPGPQMGDPAVLALIDAYEAKCAEYDALVNQIRAVKVFSSLETQQRRQRRLVSSVDGQLDQYTFETMIDAGNLADIVQWVQDNVHE